jgi:hypothetical protein
MSIDADYAGICSRLAWTFRDYPQSLGPKTDIEARRGIRLRVGLRYPKKSAILSRVFRIRRPVAVAVPTVNTPLVTAGRRFLLATHFPAADLPFASAPLLQENRKVRWVGTT